MAFCNSVLNVQIAEDRLPQILELLAQTMTPAVLPNLQTIQLHLDYHKTLVAYNMVQESFKSVSFPQVETAALSNKLRFIARRCPNLRSLFPIQGGWSGQVVLADDVFVYTPKLEVLGNIPFQEKICTGKPPFSSLDVASSPPSILKAVQIPPPFLIAPFPAIADHLPLLRDVTLTALHLRSAVKNVSDIRVG